MEKDSAGEGMTVGLDLSDKESTYVVLDRDGKVAREGKVATTAPELKKLFQRMAPAMVALEVGTHSPWASRLVGAQGHRVVVANPRQLPLISRSQRKTDRTDAEMLARLARADETLLSPIRHRGQEAQEHRSLIQSRAHLVESRTAHINHIRGTVKAHGGRLPGCSAPAFARKVASLIPQGLEAGLLPLVDLVARLTQLIRHYDREIERLATEVYPESGMLQQVPGVGALTAVTFILTLEDKGRFRRSRQVGAYLGLVPKQEQSGELRPQLGITHAGDRCLRTLLVQCAHWILGPFGKDCDLRRFGLKLATRGAGNQKKRAVVAVARKLAVLLHHLWVSGEVYEPFRQQPKGTPMAA